MIRVLLVNDYREKGGAEKVAQNIYTYYSMDESISIDFFYGTENKKTNLLGMLHSLLRLRNQFRDNTYDIVHIHKFNQVLSPFIYLLIPRGIKVITHLHDFTVYCTGMGVNTRNTMCEGGAFHINCRRFKDRRINILHDFMKRLRFTITRYMLKKYSDIFISPSRLLRECLIEKLNINREKTYYLPNYIDIDVEDGGENESKNSILYIGRLSREKGVENIIYAFARMKEKYNVSTSLYVIGDGPQKMYLETLIRKLDLQDEIIFTNFLQQEEIKRFLHNAICVVLPSICLENNPLAVLESMIHGVPVIASNIGGCPELITHETSGILVSIDDLEGWADAMYRMISNPIMVSNYGKEARKMILNNFDKNVFYKKLTKIYQSYGEK